MFNDDCKKHHDAIMRSDAVKDKIRNTVLNKIKSGKMFDEEHRKNLSESSKIRCFINKDGITKRVKKSDVQTYLDLGWILGFGAKLSAEHQQALINSHLGKSLSAESRQKMSQFHKGKVLANKGVPVNDTTKAKLRAQFKGRRWMNNSIVQKQIRPELIDSFLELGWVFGQLKIKR